MAYAQPAGNAANFVVSGASYSPPAGSAADFKPEYFAYLSLTLPVTTAVIASHGVQGVSSQIAPITLAVFANAPPAAEAFPEVRMSLSVQGTVVVQGGSDLQLPVGVAVLGSVKPTGFIDLLIKPSASASAGALVWGEASYGFSPVVEAESRFSGGAVSFSPTISVSAKGTQGAFGPAAFSVTPRVSVLSDRYVFGIVSAPVRIGVSAAGQRGISGVSSSSVTLCVTSAGNRGVVAAIGAAFSPSVSGQGRFSQAFVGQATVAVPLTAYADDQWRDNYSDVLFVSHRENSVVAYA